MSSRMKLYPTTIKVAPYVPYGAARNLLTFPDKSTKKARKREESLTWIEILKSYCDQTSLHGFKYLSEDNRPWYERCYWLVAIIVVCTLLTFTMHDQLTRFFRNPILTSFEPVLTPVFTIPFPSITICPDTQVYTSAFNLTDALININSLQGENLEKMYIALTACQIFGYDKDVGANYSMETLRQMRDTVVGEENVARMVSMIFWNSEREFVDISKYYQPLTTSFGACISYNMMPFDQILRYPPDEADNWAQKYIGGRKPIWSPDDGYAAYENQQLIPPTPPWHQDDLPSGGELLMLLKLPKEDGVDLSCNRRRGFVGFIHNPAELPGQSHPSFYANGNQSTTLFVLPRINTIDKALKSWTPKERGCYFQEEKWLKFFKVYTQRNCELECSTNFTIELCGCVSSFFRPNNVDVGVCGSSETFIICLQSNKNMSEMNRCNCLPSCSELQYSVNTMLRDRDWADQAIYYIDESNVHTALGVKFEGKYAQGIKRSALFGWMDFIANIGGLLGLFLGFSILSVIELVYHFTLRNYKKLIPHNKKKEIKKRIPRRTVYSYKSYI